MGIYEIFGIMYIHKGKSSTLLQDLAHWAFATADSLNFSSYSLALTPVPRSVPVMGKDSLAHDVQ